MSAPYCAEPSCPEYGDYDFGEATCPAEHSSHGARRNRCGTTDGWNDHKRADNPVCELCKAAHAGYQTAWRQRMKLRAKPARHGTERGLITHWAWDENPCPRCQAWWRAYLRGLSLEGQR